MAEEIEQHVLKRYQILQRIGKGAYEIVWKATDKKYSKTVILKKLYDAFANNNDARHTYREVTFLQELRNHENIIRLRNVIRAKNDKDLYLALDYMEADLHHVIRANILEDVHKHYIMYQILKAVKYMHSAEVIHRNLTPSNILIDSECSIKVTNFAWAHSIAFMQKKIDHDFVSCSPANWYRAPEILHGSSSYSKAIDMWYVGCILGEMILGKPLFQGTSLLNTLQLQFELIGKPKKEDIELIENPNSKVILNSVNVTKKKSFHSFFPKASEAAIDLLKKLLVFNPDDRLTVEEALSHEYVKQFSSPDEEKVCDYVIMHPFNDDAKFTKGEYREFIYAEIARAKKAQKKKLLEKKQSQQGAKQNI